jgi:hypothetical protein
MIRPPPPHHGLLEFESGHMYSNQVMYALIFSLIPVECPVHYADFLDFTARILRVLRWSA